MTKHKSRDSRLKLIFDIECFENVR